MTTILVNVYLSLAIIIFFITIGLVASYKIKESHERKYNNGPMRDIFWSIYRDIKRIRMRCQHWDVLQLHQRKVDSKCVGCPFLKSGDCVLQDVQSIIYHNAVCMKFDW